MDMLFCYISYTCRFVNTDNNDTSFILFVSLITYKSASSSWKPHLCIYLGEYEGNMLTTQSLYWHLSPDVCLHLKNLEVMAQPHIKCQRPGWSGPEKRIYTVDGRGRGGYSLHIVWLTAITSMPWPASPDQEQLPSWGSPIMCRVWSECRRKKWVQIAPLTGALAPGWAKEITVHLAPVQCGCLLRLPRAIRSCEFDTKKKTRLAIEEIPGTSETHALADLQWAV